MSDVQTVDDLNFKATRDTGLYDEVCMMRVESLDLADVAGGGDPLPLTYTAGGDDGPTSDAPAVDGIGYSGVNDFTLTEVASWVGFLRDGVLHLCEPLPDPVGPGPVPYVHGIGPSAL